MEESLQSIWECDDELPDFFDDPDDQEQHPPPLPPPAAAVQPSPHQTLSLLEDGEIGPTSGCLQLDCSFRFVANDLDAAVKNAKKAKKTKKANRKREKRKSHRSKNTEIDPKVSFITCTCRFLKEPKGHLIEAAVESLGIEVVRDLVHEVETIEKNGGQMTADGRRRRTPGGVLWNVLRSRYEENYKAIMAAGKDFERQRKRKVQVDGMDIDGQPSIKRRRTGTAESFTGPVAQVKRTGVTVWPSRCKEVDNIQSKVDPDNFRILTQVQSAWAVGVKQGKHKSGPDDMEMYDDMVRKKPTSMAERLRVPIQYDDLVET
eukprot:c5329_g1_i1 orf=257-1210(-)